LYRYTIKIEQIIECLLATQKEMKTSHERLEASQEWMRADQEEMKAMMEAWLDRGQVEGHSGKDKAVAGHFK
jgi:hypothetical protein